MLGRGTTVGLVAALAACGGNHRAVTPAARPVAQSRTVAPRPEPLTPDAVLATIQSKYMRDLERCYGRQLKKDPRLGGRVTVMLTVDTTGRLSDRRARGITERVESCVERAMESWSFPPAAADEQSFQLSFRLRPT
ncbi:MAG TPA: AgmX/PglI C-terminal domain-containing protein [Kofleriaceae bacterium]|nr:AgmX/PglI C-terminal domain-containing protein [Kofleriaceae bacterium]